MKRLAQRLIAEEMTARADSMDRRTPGEEVCAKLRNALVRLAGVDGFVALMRRSITLGRKNDPSLHAVAVDANGSVSGVDQVDLDAAAVLVASLLDLLEVFIGEALTLGVVLGSWPELEEKGELNYETER